VKSDGRRRPRAQGEEGRRRGEGESVTTRNTLSNWRSKKTGRGNEKKKRKMDETRLDVRREEWEWK